MAKHKKYNPERRAWRGRSYKDSGKRRVHVLREKSVQKEDHTPADRNLRTPPVDPERFLHTWCVACAAADGEVRPLRGIAGATVTLRDGRQLFDLQVADNPAIRFLTAITSGFRSVGPVASASAAARMIALLKLAAEGQLQRWARVTDAGPTAIHEALIRSAAQARFTSLTGFNLADLEARAVQHYEEAQRKGGT